MELVKWLTILSLGLQRSVALRNEVEMIVNVMRFYEKPTAVVAKICWGVSEKIGFAREVIKTQNAKTIQIVEKYQTIEKYIAEDMLIILDLNCSDRGTFLQEKNRTNKFEKPYRWMLLSESELDVVPSELNSLSILVDSEVILAYKTRNNDTVLRTVYKIDSAGDFIIEPFAIWTVDNRLIVSKVAKLSIPERRKNLRKKRVGVSIVSGDDTTQTEIYNLNNIVKDNLAKSSFHNILPLYEYMNASIQLVFTDTWGYYINNTWNGMIGQIIRGDADICGTIMIMRRDRAEVLSFLTQPVRTTIRFVFRQPPLSFQNNLFYLPFRSTVWMCVGALIIILILVIYLNARWEAKKNGTKSDDPTILRPDVSDVAIFVAGAVVQQSSNSELKGSLGKIVTFIMFLMFLFLYTSYAANIVALLQSSSDQIRTLSDLLNSKIELGVEDQPYARYYFTTATDRVRKAIYETKVARPGYKPNFMSIEEGVKKLQNIGAPFAFHMNIGLGYRFVEQFFYEHEKCGLREIDYIPNGIPWVSCRKHSPYKEIYKIGLARIFEHGLGERVNKLIYSPKPACTTRGGSFSSVNMMDFHPVLLCLLYGMVAALLLLGIEILVYKRQILGCVCTKTETEEAEEADTAENISGYNNDVWIDC